MPKKVAIFIDGNNFYYGLKDHNLSTHINFEKLGVKLCSNYGELMRIYYYNAPVDQFKEPDSYRSQQKFFDKLYRTPYLEVRLGRLMKRGDTYVEKGVDVLLSVDMIQKAFENQYDIAILLSGDGDLAHAVSVVKNQGKHVINACFDVGRSHHLLEVCDDFIKFDESYLKDCY